MVARWTFTDTSTSTSYTFQYNPRDGGAPTYQKKFNYESSSAPDGKTLIYEGRDEPQKIKFSGILIYQEQYDAFVTWFKNRNQIRVTDDLGRQFTVIIESFTPTRKPSRNFAWRHDYEITATLTQPA